jgi:hypothetical protein
MKIKSVMEVRGERGEERGRVRVMKAVRGGGLEDWWGRKKDTESYR